jgi:hypothetical protein
MDLISWLADWLVGYIHIVRDTDSLVKQTTEMSRSIPTDHAVSKIFNFYQLITHQPSVLTAIFTQVFRTFTF